MTKDEGQATVDDGRLAGADLSSSVVRLSSQDNTPSSAAADRQAFFILKNLGAAVREFDMIRDGDRIAVAVSGGKDSLGLLHLLKAYRRSAGVRFELAAIHVLGDATGVIELHPPLGEWLAAQDVPHRIVMPDLAADDDPPLNCQRCTWLRRKAIFQAADALGCNVVAFAHHADDAAQTTLLNLLYGGDVRTLAPCADYFDGHFRLIRPLIYVPETDLTAFRPRQQLSAAAARLPAFRQLAAPARGRDAEAVGPRLSDPGAAESDPSGTGSRPTNDEGPMTKVY